MKQASLYRCLPKAHCGWTRGAGSGASYCCLYFARGIWWVGAGWPQVWRKCLTDAQLQVLLELLALLQLLLQVLLLLRRPSPLHTFDLLSHHCGSHHGSDCNYLHRLPTAADEERHKTDYSHGRGC